MKQNAEMNKVQRADKKLEYRHLPEGTADQGECMGEEFKDFEVEAPVLTLEPDLTEEKEEITKNRRNPRSLQ